MAGRQAGGRRRVLVVGAVLVAAGVLGAVAAPVEAARRPAPTHVSLTAADQTSLTVHWHRVRNAHGYRVRWSTRHSMRASHRLASTRHWARIRGLRPGTRYFVQVAVAAHHGHGRRLGRWSRVVTRRTAAVPCPVLGNLGDPTPAVPSGAPADVRVASFNIRTINLDSADHPEQRWRSRAGRVTALLLGAGTTRNPASAPPDVIALQEANQSYAKFATRCTNQLIDLRNRLDAGGAHRYEATNLRPGASVGTRILFDTTRLRLERSGAVLLASSTTTHPHLSWAIFQVRNGGQRFFFGSVHLVPAENANSNTVRDREWDRLLALLTDPTLTRGLPVLLAGDFNSPRSGSGANTSALTHLPRMARAGVADTLLGGLDPADRELTASQARAESTANAHCHSTNSFRVAQQCADDPDLIGQQIDYLFASDQVLVDRWELVLDLDDLGNWLGTIPSDHNLLRATVTLPGMDG